MSHSCGVYPLAAHFRGRPDLVRETFERFRSLVRRAGPATVYAQKTRIVFLTRVRFSAVIVHPSWLEATLWLTRVAAHPCLQRIEHLGPRAHVHHFRLDSPEQADNRLLALIRESYSVGRQQHLAEDT